MNITRRNLTLQLCKAVNDGDPRQVEVLLKRGADPNLVSPKGVAAVHLAAGKETEKRICCLKLLLQHQADPNVRSVDDLTPLHIAALWGCYQNLHLLLQNGGDPSLVDQEGNTAADLASQQENRKCAQILQEYLSYSQLESEHEDPSRCQFSLYRSCGGDGSFFHELVEDGVLDDSSESVLGDCPLSSTRRSLQDSDHLDLSAISARNSWGGRGSLSGQPAQQWRRGSDQGGGLASVLSSTRVSTSGRTDSQAVRVLLPVLQEDVALSDSHFQPGATDRGSPEPVHKNAGGASAVRAPLPARRKSVSFREVDEYFPACRAESPVHPGSEKDQPDSSADTTVDFSTYSDFMDSERMVTVMKFQGLDVTSPDHVFVFCQQDNSTSPSLDKTVMEQYFLEEEEEEVVEVQQAADRGPPIQALTRGSSSSSSQYNSCESECYHSVMDTSLQHRAASAEEAAEGSLANGRNSPLPLAPGVQQGSSASGGCVMVRSPNPRSNLPFSLAGDWEAENRSPSTGGAATRGEGSSQEEESKRDSPRVREVSQGSLSPSQATVPVQRSVASPSLGSEEAGFREMLRILMLSTKVPQPLPAADGQTETREDPEGEETLPDTVLISASNAVSLRGGSDHQLEKEIILSSKFSSGNRVTPIGVEVAEQNSPPRSLTPSSFVTGRSKIRQSRCLLRTSSINSSTASSSCASLFEETIPTPVRLRRRERSPPGDPRGTPLQESHDGEETESGTGRLGTSEEAASTGFWSRGWEGSEGAGASQADTVLISGPGCSQASTVMIERNPPTEGTGNRGNPVATVVVEKSVRGEDVNDVFHPKGLFQEDEVTLPNGDGTDIAGFLTDDCSSISGDGIKIAPQEAPRCPSDSSAQRDESWMTEDGENTRLEERLQFAARDNPSRLYPPGPSSSSDSGREHCGSRVSARCGSRYSISRLSGAPQALRKFEANLSFTPGGRPLILGVAEPVEFLYTDEEEGHALIVPRASHRQHLRVLGHLCERGDGAVRLEVLPRQSWEREGEPLPRQRDPPPDPQAEGRRAEAETEGAGGGTRTYKQHDPARLPATSLPSGAGALREGHQAQPRVQSGAGCLPEHFHTARLPGRHDGTVPAVRPARPEQEVARRGGEVQLQLPAAGPQGDKEPAFPFLYHKPRRTLRDVRPRCLLRGQGQAIPALQPPVRGTGVLQGGQDQQEAVLQGAAHSAGVGRWPGGDLSALLPECHPCGGLYPRGLHGRRHRVKDADQSEEGRLLWGGGDLANETAASDGRAPAPQRHAHLSGGGGEAAAADRHPRGAVKWFDPLLLEPWQLRGSRAVRECHGD